MTPDEMVVQAALRFRCWTCMADPGQGCTSDYSDHGIQPCSPHEGRMLDAVRVVITELAARWSGVHFNCPGCGLMLKNEPPY